MFKKVYLIFLLLIILPCLSSAESQSNHRYIFWEGLEADKCGVAWLVKRYVDPEAVFEIVKKGKTVNNGIMLDTPDSRIQRKLNSPAFEIALIEYKITSPVLKQISKIIWDIEVNKWDKKVTVEAPGLAVIFRGIANEPNQEEALERSLIIFDALQAGLKSAQ